MAYITLERTKRTLDDPEEMRAFLTRHGITYEKWGIPSRVVTLAEKDRLEDSEKQQVLQTYRLDLERLKQEKGYIQNDVVALCPTTPQIDQLLSKFDREHYHTDDEVRFIFGGRGIFGFEARGRERFTIEVVAGDYLVIPAYHWHWFTLGENRTIKAVRLFQTMEGWAPYYRDAITDYVQPHTAPLKQ